jgi:hypothetical protein
MDDPEVVELVAAGALAATSGHGALEEPDGVYVRIVPCGTIHSYGLGVNPIELIRDPLHAGGRSVRLDPDDGAP